MRYFVPCFSQLFVLCLSLVEVFSELQLVSCQVHCAGGRGRTATMIAACIIREHGWGARDAIAWLRLVRPGSVLGKQQEFLASLCDHQDEEE